MCSFVRCTCTPNIKCLSLLDQMLWPKWMWTFRPIYLTIDLERWPWPQQITFQNMWLEQMHMHAKYEVSILMVQKLWPMLKLSSNRQTNKQTDKQTGQKQYAPQIWSGGHRNWKRETDTLIHIYTHTYTHTDRRAHTYIHAYWQIHTSIHTYIHTCLYIHTYIHTYMHTITYTHTHIHTYHVNTDRQTDD